MHNRDFPTLWALWHLAEAAQTAGEPVVFAEWLGRVVADAWELARRLPGDQFDTAGFPSNAAKSDASEGRFVKFFIGDEQGTGPFFDLGLAGFERGRVAPTQAGLVLLRALEGFGCQRERELLSIWTESYLRHLANHAPADLAFMSAILRHIGNGQDERATLLEVVAGDYPSWTDSVTDTNVAGFIARAREWGLLLSRQRKGKYVLNPGAIVALDDASRA